MKINIELEPAELADFLAVFASNSAACIRRYEEAIAEMLVNTGRIEVTQKQGKKNDDKELIKKPEDLYRGYTH